MIVFLTPQEDGMLLLALDLLLSTVCDMACPLCVCVCVVFFAFFHLGEPHALALRRVHVG
jgi:hypothetical protein